MKVHEKIRTLRGARTYIPKLEQIAEIFEVDLVELIPQNGKNVYMNNNNGSGCNIIGSLAKLAFEVQKQQIADLREYAALLKNNNA